jgi:signal transduction histidine kinase
VAHAVDAALRMVRARAERSEVKLVVEVPRELPYLFADERKLKQVLLNVLSNAVKFTPAGGTVAIRAEERTDCFAIVIADTGIGIAEADIAKAFEPFGQIDSTLSRKHEGTGLGLPLAAAMVREHGGTLTLTSTVGAGTTVTIALPRARIRAQLEQAV